MSEHTEVRLPLIEKLIKLGWDENQIQYKPEWGVPKSPSEASKRELGQRYNSYPCDVVIFDHPSNLGEYEHIQIIIETKAPDKNEGINQLKIYMGLEPHAMLGIWTNGTDISRVYRLPNGSFDVEKKSDIPSPGESLIRGGDKKLHWNDLVPPTTLELKKSFKKLLNVIVTRDTKSTRRDDQLNSLCNVLLAKLEGDKIAKFEQGSPCPFQVWNTERKTADRVRNLFKGMKRSHKDLFVDDSDDEINFDDHTISMCAFELANFQLRDTPISIISEAFQIFRTSSLKSEEGQYYTPFPVIRSAIKLMEISPSDTVLDPACGTGGFVLEAFRQLVENHPTMSKSDTIAWANRNLYAVDKDRINVKLTKAIMLTIGDGSTNTFLGDSIRQHLWKNHFPELQTKLRDGSFSCILTNPPFGKNLKVSKSDAKASSITVSRKPKKLSNGEFEFSKSIYTEREIGILFVERCYKLLEEGGRLGIILPETYMFSPSYGWFRQWIESRFILIGFLNIKMEAFQGFCRAKTNFYIFEKTGDQNEKA
jgi:type I restriction enzyme M protein